MNAASPGFGDDAVFDLLVVGGGINGAGIARDAAGRGLSVVLLEQHDLASHTSSASTKLIHGGLRYLEYREFRLVREALREREVLLRIAPHIAWPLRFVLPHARGMRPAWMLRLGLLLYDRLGGSSTLPRSASVTLTAEGLGAGLRPGLRRGFAYSDAWVEDSRLVVLNAMDAARRGARVLTRTKLLSARRQEDVWVARLADGTALRARAMVNAAGPFVGAVAGVLGHGRAPVRLVRGSHIVLRRLYAGEHAYLLQNTDGRVVFAIPYESAFTLIGTTDVTVQSPDEVQVSDAEVAYLCEAVNRWFAAKSVPGDVVWRYAGIRALFDDGAAEAKAVTRDYVLELDAPEDGPKLLSVFGGKITTYRRLAEHALERLGFPGAWTAAAALPGGDFHDFAALLRALQARYSFLHEGSLRRLAHAYGTAAQEVLGEARNAADLGEDFGAGLRAAEIAYLQQHEFARTAEDVLWRRSKLGLHMSAAQRERVAGYLGG